MHISYEKDNQQLKGDFGVSSSSNYISFRSLILPLCSRCVHPCFCQIDSLKAADHHCLQSNPGRIRIAATTLMKMLRMEVFTSEMVMCPSLLESQISNAILLSNLYFFCIFYLIDSIAFSFYTIRSHISRYLDSVALSKGYFPGLDTI